MLKAPGTVRRCARLVRWLVPALLPCAAFAVELSVKIEGVPKEIREAVLADLALTQYSRDPSPAQVRRLFKAAADDVRKSLEPFGYYNATVDSKLNETEKGYEAVFNVTPGAPVVVREQRVKVDGPGAEIRQVQRAIRRFAPAPGERLDHGLYEQSKERVGSALFETGFLRAKAEKHRVEVSRKSSTADIDLLWTSGPRMTFGPVRFSEAQFPPDFLRRYIPWEQGAYYSPESLLELQQRLTDAEYFATVVVVPDTSNDASTEVPVDVTLTPAKRSVYSAGVFVSTDTGPGVRTGLQRRWVNDKGHKLKGDMEYAQRLKSISAGYRIPLKGRNERSYNIGVNYRDEMTDTSTSRTESLTTNESRRWHGFTRTLGMTYLSGNFEIAEEQDFSTLFYFEGTLSKKEANDLSFPRRGYSFGLTARYAPEVLFTDTTFTSVQADAKWIHTLGRRNRILLRGTLGTMVVDDFDVLPPELRFFAGGDRSIRGFDYQQLGTTNEEGLVIGGTQLVVASVEVERYFLSKWGAAVFVDGGDAFRTNEFDTNVGAGIGVRWRSPVGVLRVDLAKPVVSDLADEWRIHFSVGPDL